MLGRILRTALVKQMEHFMFQSHTVVAFFNDVVLMEHMTHKMSVIQFMDDFIVDFGRQGFKPITIITAQGDIECNQILYFIIMYRTVTDRGRSHSKAMQHGRLRFFGITFEECAAMGCKIFLQESTRFFYALATHF